MKGLTAFTDAQGLYIRVPDVFCFSLDLRHLFLHLPVTFSLMIWPLSSVWMSKQSHGCTRKGILPAHLRSFRQCGGAGCTCAVRDTVIHQLERGVDQCSRSGGDVYSFKEWEAPQGRRCADFARNMKCCYGQEHALAEDQVPTKSSNTHH